MLRVHLRRRQVVRSRRYAAIGIILLPSDQYTIVNTRPSVYDSMCTVVGVAVGICSLEYCNLYDRRYTAVGITTVVGLRPSVYIRCLRPSVYIHWYTAVGFMHDHCISRALRALIPMYHPYREYLTQFQPAVLALANLLRAWHCHVLPEGFCARSHVCFWKKLFCS